MPSRHRILNDRQRKFAELLAAGNSQSQAYLSAGYRSGDARKLASRLAAKPEIIEYLNQIREDSRTATMLEIQEKREFLARVIRTAICEVDEHSDLAQELTVRIEGEESRIEKIRMVSKLDALRLDSQLAGHLDSRSSVSIHNTVVNEVVERSQAEIDKFLERKARIMERMGLD